MISYTDPDQVRREFTEIREDLDNEEDLSVIKDKLDLAISDFDELTEDYDSQINNMDADISEQNEEIEDLREQVGALKPSGGSLELYAASMLQSFTGHEPSMGEVLSLKDDLEKLLTTKYNISMGNL